MESSQHSRPLWVGLVACTFFVPSLMAILQMFTVESVVIGPVLVFIVGSVISGLATALAAVPLVLVLRHVGWLNAILLCVIGTAVGAVALGWFAFSDSQYPQMNDQSLARWIARQAAFKAMVPGAIYGFLSAVALCVGAGITIRSSRSRFRGSA
jgi:hypothetical protein